MKHLYLIALMLTGIVSPSLVQASWEILDLPTDRGFTAIWAINEQTIFVIGHQGLWTTFDGKEWVLDSTYQPSYIYFADDTLGFLWGSILTIDGGHTWRKGDTVNGNVVPVHFARGQSLVGYGLGYDYACKTTDGGWHWDQLPPLPDVYPGFDEIISPDDICFPKDPDTGYLTVTCIKQLSDGEIEYHNSYFKTTDGGQTWVLNEEGLWNDDFNPRYIDFPQNASVGYMAGGGGKVYKTTDGGATWDTVLKDRPYIVSMCFPESDQVGYVFGDSVAHKTTDGGKTWKEAVITHDSTFYKCHFINDSVGFVTGHKNMTLCMPYDPGFVLKTTDGLLGISEDDWVDVVPELVELSAPALFSRELACRYQARESGRIRLTLFDAAGREVQSLGWCEVGCGEGSLSFNGALLPTGVYFIRVEFSSAQGSQNQKLRAVKVQ
ncbi:hypothetical protein CEE36_01570 [candidate division TA06 bacterium B3_TA06]|uniref:Photosynthesis system II assembly factor Ycf48/Hcf136-like domain-containing protein n=1 Tax=candidate division TA06 bacterium B3_TA06 TaxID=2012487 RepID=A0A532V9E3_UNCT6|nr:MAG: hypothetical protein CEE36_01570 [candidate division TA06 bacterium B3_TA06]